MVLEDGGRLGYEHLILATGARARALAIPARDLDGVLVAAHRGRRRSAEGGAGPGRRLAVIGGGYIGLEAAASARALGAEAVVIEREARVLARVACEALSDFFTDYHRARGVDLRARRRRRWPSTGGTAR